MGEPVPGDIADPIYLKTTNVPVAGGVDKKKGDFLNYSSTDSSWAAISTTNIAPVPNPNFIQLQEDIDATGQADGAMNAAGFATGSRIYAMAGSVMPAGSKCRLVAYAADKVGFAKTYTQPVSAAIASNVVTCTTTGAHGLKPGDAVTIDAGSGDLDGADLIVSSVTSDTVFTAALTAANAAAVTGTITVDVEDNPHLADATFVKPAGATVVRPAAVDDVGIFALGGVA